MSAQIIAIIIFVAMFLFIIIEKWERHITTTVSAAAALIFVFGAGLHSPEAALKTLNFGAFTSGSFLHSSGEAVSASGINWGTIVFIAGMMIMVEGMAMSGFFRWLCMKLAKLVNYRIVPLFVTFMILSAVLSMFIDSITVILFLAAITIELAEMLEFNPIPMILTEIFCANLGGTATMCGNPPNIIIGTSLGLSFNDFLTNTGVIVLISTVAVVIYFFLVYRRKLSKNIVTEEMINKFPDASSLIPSKGKFAASIIVFVAAVVLLITHGQTGLTVSAIGIIVTVATIIIGGRQIGEIFKKVDYKTLLFFIGLFVVVGGLEETGVLNIMAGFISNASHGNIFMMLVIITIVSAVASAFVDNIPFAATMLPVITTIAGTQGVDLAVLAWALTMGANIGGNATPIGASANVVGIATASQKGYIIKWGRYCKTAVPAVIIVMVISIIVMKIRYC